MSKEKQIEEMAWDLCDIPMHPSVHSCKECGGKHCHAQYYAERAYNAGYRKQSEVIDDFVKRLFDAFPECNRDNRCPAIYYDDYREIIEEVATKMKDDRKVDCPKM